jgi:SOS-response transcriptional repressor LexA
VSRRAPSAATADDVLRYVAGYLEAHDGISPSYQNICDALGIHSKSNIDRKMDELGARGLIARRWHRARCLELLAPVDIPRGPAGEPLYFVRSASWA